MMTKRVVGKGIARILELSADAQIQRRAASKNSRRFHNLTRAIAAYGEALALLATPYTTRVDHRSKTTINVL